MNIFYIFFLLFFAIISNVVADENIIVTEEKSYIDMAHDIISDKVVDYSNSIDNVLSGMLKKSYKNSTTIQANDDTKSVDSFFRDKKYTDETDETYVSINLNSNFNSDGTKDFNIAINARLPLTASTKKYNLFINDLTKDNANNLINRESNTQSRAEIGINYFAPIFNTIKSKYSIGTNGINPFTIARYRIEKEFYSWKVEPSQRFKYSLKDNFEEETDIYFDKQLALSRLFRITLSRGTQTDSSGMDYGLSLAHYWTFNKTTALSLSQSLSGNTEYHYGTNNPNIPAETKKDAGITNYSTALNFRKSAWRKWLFYGISPSLNFTKANNYKANYNFNFYLDLYFGHLK